MEKSINLLFSINTAFKNGFKSILDEYKAVNSNLSSRNHALFYITINKHKNRLLGAERQETIRLKKALFPEYCVKKDGPYTKYAPSFSPCLRTKYLVFRCSAVFGEEIFVAAKRKAQEILVCISEHFHNAVAGIYLRKPYVFLSLRAFRAVLLFNQHFSRLY